MATAVFATATCKVYTSAPAAYDGFSTRTLRALPLVDRRGNPVREVEIKEGDHEWQTTRYGSGNFPCTTKKLFWQNGIFRVGTA